jgi:PadR family transcriptional regulator, regulatory protein PadR
MKMPRRPNTSPQAIAVLSTLLENADRWRHGYDIMRATGMKSGTLYPLLIRLSESGLLEAEWSAPEAIGRGPRHLYRLTKDGIAFAHNVASNSAAGAARQPIKLKPAAVSS